MKLPQDKWHEEWTQNTWRQHQRLRLVLVLSALVIAALWAEVLFR